MRTRCGVPETCIIKGHGARALQAVGPVILLKGNFADSFRDKCMISFYNHLAIAKIRIIAQRIEHSKLCFIVSLQIVRSATMGSMMIGVRMIIAGMRE